MLTVGRVGLILIYLAATSGAEARIHHHRDSESQAAAKPASPLSAAQQQARDAAADKVLDARMKGVCRGC
jgi:hypothetical protein